MATYNILIACDTDYYNNWAMNLALSIRGFNPWINVVMHITNPVDIDELPNVRYVYDYQDLHDGNRSAYYQCARFLACPELFAPDEYVMSLDADSICTQAFTSEQFQKVAAHPHMLFHEKQHNWLAGLVTFGVDNDFRNVLRSRLLELPIKDWEYGHDQTVLRQLVEDFDIQPVYRTDWMCIGKGDGVFLTLKGNQKEKNNFVSKYNVSKSRSRYDVNSEHIRDLRAVALIGPWIEGLPLPNIKNIEVKRIGDVDRDNLPDVWIIHNNINNKRTKKFDECYKLITQSGRPWIVVESPVFRYNQADPDSDDVYYRWSWFNYARDDGIHHAPCSLPDRWHQIRREQDIKIRPWASPGEDVLFLMQRPGDSSLYPITQEYGSYEQFVQRSIEQIRNNTDRHIRVRLHPLRQDAQIAFLEHLQQKINNISLSGMVDNNNNPWVSGGESLYRDFARAWAVVGANSNGLVESACYGVPTWCLHPSAMAYPVSQTSLHMLENPDLTIDRRQWLWNLGYSQWRRDEIEQGDSWCHLMQWWPKVQELRQQRADWVKQEQSDEDCFRDNYLAYWQHEGLVNMVRRLRIR